jgi:sec-independent protein translocase protein TatA
MWGLGFWQVLVILIMFLVLFGPKRLPDLGSSLGKAIRNFKKSIAEDEIEENSDVVEKIESDHSSDKESEK